MKPRRYRSTGCGRNTPSGGKQSLTVTACSLWLFVPPSRRSPGRTFLMQQLNPSTSPDRDDIMPTERRASVRYTGGRDCTCRPALAQSSRGIPAWWADISTLGIGLVLEQCFEPGTVLVVELGGEPRGPTRLLLARVRHVASWGRERWWLGCKLCSELTSDELETLLAGSPGAADQGRSPRPDATTVGREPCR